MANPAVTPYLSVRDVKLSNTVRTACPIQVEKSCSSHLFWVVPSQAAQMHFAPKLSKAITFLSYVLSW